MTSRKGKTCACIFFAWLNAALCNAGMDYEPADAYAIPALRKTLGVLADVASNACLLGQYCGANNPVSALMDGANNNIKKLTDAGYPSPAVYAVHFREALDGHWEVNWDISVQGIRQFYTNRTGFVCVYLTPENPYGPFASNPGELTPAEYESLLVYYAGSTNANAYIAKLYGDYADCADGLLNLAADNIPVIFRPYQEMNATKWFGYGPDPELRPQYCAYYRLLWQELFDYLHNARGVHNIAWCYTPAHAEQAKILEHYPGSNYVDIVGLTRYSAKSEPTMFLSSSAQSWSILRQLDKILCLSEASVISPVELHPGDADKLATGGIVNTNVAGDAAFAVVWTGEHRLSFQTNLTAFFSHPGVLIKDDAPDFRLFKIRLSSDPSLVLASNLNSEVAAANDHEPQPANVWRLLATGVADMYRINLLNTGLYLAADGTNDGDRITLSGTAQEWALQATGDGAYVIRHADSPSGVVMLEAGGDAVFDAGDLCAIHAPYAGWTQEQWIVSGDLAPYAAEPETTPPQRPVGLRVKEVLP